MKIKFIPYLLGFLLSSALLNSAFTQQVHPVLWTTEVKNLSDSIAEIRFNAALDEGWELYALSVPQGGPLPTVFTFVKNNNYTRTGKMITNPPPTVSFDDIFEIDVGKWKKNVTFIQKIKILNFQKFSITIDVEYMVCDNVSCIPLSDNFEIHIDGTAFQPNLSVKDTGDDTLKTDIVHTEIPDTSVFADAIQPSEKTTSEKSKTSWFIFWLGMLGGFLSLLTPCVWPVIPITVSFFINKSQTKRSAVRDAFFYCISVVVIYVTLGFVISIIFGPGALGNLATSPGFNIFFFLLLIVFALAFFGAFELTLPSKWVNAINRKSDKSSGLTGIFFMALTLVLISFSCTGPILGALLVEAASVSSFTAPLIGMLGFSIALAIPFSLLSIFPSWLKSMPKSGGWMNSVKVVLAFLLLAFSLRFLSVADSIAGWGILSRDVFISIWLIIFMLIGFYLLGKIKMKHDTDIAYISTGRLFFAVISFTIAALLLPGLWGAPLKFISGFLPPPETQSFNLNRQIFIEQTTYKTLKHDYNIKVGAHQLIKFLDYEEGLEFARKQNKPIFLDFTGLGCANCKKMENVVFGQPEVLPLLRDNYVIIALYVDNRERLPEDKQYVSEISGRKIKTIGQQWSDFQTLHFGVNAQPYYVLLDYDGNRLAEPRAYNTDVNAFAEFLKNGIESFEQRTNNNRQPIDSK